MKKRGVDDGTDRTAEVFERFAAFASRVFVWCTLFLAVYMLRSFSLLIFLTFVFGYIQANIVDSLKPQIKRRGVRVVAAACLVLTVMGSIGAFLVPRVKEQALLFADRYPAYLQAADRALGDLAQKYPIIQRAMPDLPIDPSAENPAFDPRRSVIGGLIQSLSGFEEEGGGQHSFRNTVDRLKDFGGHALAAVSSFLLSLLFSFLIVLDLESLRRGALNLEKTKLRFIYREVAPSIRDFSGVMGRALEAQLIIALLNTALTVAGLYMLGLGEKSAFLALIVFLCSFIPVAGVFISSVPICLVALQEAGIPKMFLAVLLITVIHMIEAYILNPRIYGAHLRMNPVIVLIILTIGGKLFGVWGLVLGVPICTYIFGPAIREK